MSQDTKPTGGAPATAFAATQTRVSVRELKAPDAGAPVVRYREHGVLGRGGMGEVKLVEDSIIGREVAVKTITTKLTGSTEMRERFLREIRIQGQLEHPAIVPVYDVGVDAAGNDFFTMKRIGGRTLASIVRSLAADDASTRQAFPRNALLGVFRQVCLAIAYAHTKGVLHRDLKPANIMVGDFGEVYVLDWGIARLVDEPVEADEGAMLGTPGYMAPEQLDDANAVDTRADVYALGAILFELLALEPWHPASSVAEAIASTRTSDAARPSLRAAQRDIPPELDDLCAAATAADREARVASARELADAIERYLEGDRDLERRRALAKQHAAVARQARERLVTATAEEALVARRDALREAGRAVALDPEGREGLRAAIEVMLEPPREVPAEVTQELERAQADRVRAGLLPGIVVFGVFAVAAIVTPLVAGAVSWLAPTVIAVALGIALGLAATLLRSQNLARERGVTLLIAASAATAIGFTSTYLGPMMLVPPLAVALACALTAAQSEWRPYLAVCVLAVTVPFVLEWAGVVPRSYEFSAEGMLVKPVAMQLSEGTVRIASLLATVGALVGSVLYVRRIVVVETELRTAWLLHNWHLRQMAQVTGLQ